jgi:hypothetical protein
VSESVLKINQIKTIPAGGTPWLSGSAFGHWSSVTKDSKNRLWSQRGDQTPCTVGGWSQCANRLGVKPETPSACEGQAA